MANRERAKGVSGEREVATIFQAAGLTVRGLESGGDHLVACGVGGHLALHSEVKRHETARPWAWWAQALTQAPGGAMPVVAFRRNRSPWLGLVDLGQLATVCAFAAAAMDAGLTPYKQSTRP